MPNVPKLEVPFPLPDALSDDSFDRTSLLLSIEQMRLENVPLPNSLAGTAWKPAWSSFVASKRSYEPVNAQSPMFALDCEMVLTKAGSELARVTIVDEMGCVIMDQLVKPEHPVEDYVTRFVCSFSTFLRVRLAKPAITLFNFLLQIQWNNSRNAL